MKDYTSQFAIPLLRVSRTCNYSLRKSDNDAFSHFVIPTANRPIFGQKYWVIEANSDVERVIQQSIKLPVRHVCNPPTSVTSHFGMSPVPARQEEKPVKIIRTRWSRRGPEALLRSICFYLSR